jgi:hypothetical protein
MEEQGIEKALAEALAQVIREKPDKGVHNQPPPTSCVASSAELPPVGRCTQPCDWSSDYRVTDWVPLRTAAQALPLRFDETPTCSAACACLCTMCAALKRIAQLISPETFVDPDAPPPAAPAEAATDPPAAAAAEPAAEPASEQAAPAAS